MEDGLGNDMIDGKFINWDDMSVEELKKLRLKLKEKERKILDKIDEELDKLDSSR